MIFQKILKIYKKVEKGIELEKDTTYWEITGIMNFPVLLKNLKEILPENSILYFEDGNPYKELLDFFRINGIQDDIKIKFGTSKFYKIPATNNNLDSLSKITENYAEPEVAIHFHVYRQEKVLIEWHDAFSQPLLIAGVFNEKCIESFCIKLKATYRKIN